MVRRKQILVLGTGNVTSREAKCIVALICLEDIGGDCRIIGKRILKNRILYDGEDWICVAQNKFSEEFKHTLIYFGSIRGGVFLDQLRYYQLLKK
jgi:hypothetical protein